MIKKLAIYTGYAESQSNAVMLFEHDKGFNDVEEAAENIYLLIREQVSEEHNANRKECCKKNEGAKFCPDCGTRLYDELEEQVMNDYASDAFQVLHGSPCVENYELIERLRNAGWNLWGSPSDGYVSIMDFDRWIEEYPYRDLEVID